MLKLAICLLSLVATGAAAQDDSLTDLNMAQTGTANTDEEVEYGWSWAAGLTLGGNVLQNSNTVSQVEGRTNIYLGKLELSADNNQKDSEWENSLSLDETFSRTPFIDRLVKTGDVLKLSSVYKHFFPSVSWLGGFASFGMETTAFATYDEQAEKVTYRVMEADGEIREFQDERFRTAKAFNPMTLKESFGVVFKVLDDERFSTEVRTGPGAKQVMLKDQYFLVEGEEAEATEEVEFVQYTDDIRVVGWLAMLSVNGKLYEEKWTYKLTMESLTPMAYHPKRDNDPSSIKLTTTEVAAETSYKFSDWLALTYQFKSVREPLLQREAQVTHNAMLTATLRANG